MHSYQERTILSDGGPAPWPDHICDAAIEILDRAGERREIDDTLLQVLNRQVLKREIKKTVQIVETVDLDSLLSKQSWFSRFTGATLEERLKLEMAAQHVSKAFGILEKLSADTDKRIRLMRSERDSLANSLSDLAIAIEYGELLMKDRQPIEDFVRTRFERKLSNLIVVRSANQMALEQLKMVEHGLVSLNDRFREIATVLFPLWQQRLFAVVNTPGKLTRRKPAIIDFSVCHNAMVDYFISESKL